MTALLLSIKKVIAVITAIFIPTTTAAPAIPQCARVVDVAVTEKAEAVDAPQMEIVEDEVTVNTLADKNNEILEAETPVLAAEETEEAQMLVEEAPEGELEFARDEEIPAAQAWEVSEDDEAAMPLYETVEEDALIG